MKSGLTYIDLPFVDPQSANPITSGIFATLTDAYHEQVRDLIFAVPVEDWAENFYQIDDAYNLYGAVFGFTASVGYKGEVYFLTDASVWNGERLIPDGAATNNAFSVSFNGRLFPGFSVNAVGSTAKVTALPDYTADAVTFTPTKHMDVFLPPALMPVRLVAVHTRTVPPLPAPTVETNDTLDKLRFVYPRELIHDEGVSIYGQYLTGAPNWKSDGTGNTTYANIWGITDYWKGRHGVRAGRFAASTWSVLAPANYATAAMYPAPPSLPPDPTTYSLEGEFTVETPRNGTLLAVIKQGSNIYYIWQDV